jgi:hypothetical protein
MVERKMAFVGAQYGFHMRGKMGYWERTGLVRAPVGKKWEVRN